MPPTRDPSRYANIDVLRGIAALCVVWLHTAEIFVRLPNASRDATAANVAEFLQLGRVGVIAFFAISGFVVVSTIKRPKAIGIGEFAVKRFFRLYPAFWIALLLTYLVIWLPQGRPLTVSSVVANASMLPSLFGFEAAMGHFWTLEIELVFYLLVVLLFAAGKLRSSLVLVSLIAVCSLHIMGLSLYRITWTPAQGHWGQLPYCLAIMLWASLLRQTYAPNNSMLRQIRVWTTPAIVLATCLVFGRAVLGGLPSSPDVHEYLAGRGNLWGLMLFAVFLGLRFHWPKLWVWLGTISYSIYLLHPVVLYPLFFFVSSADGLLASAPLWLHILVVMAATVALASLSYVFVEAPSNAMAKRLVTPYRGNSVAQQA